MSRRCVQSPTKREIKNIATGDTRERTINRCGRLSISDEQDKDDILENKLVERAVFNGMGWGVDARPAY